MQTKLLFAAVIFSVTAIFNPAFADCFGKNVLQGEITAEDNNPSFKLEANFDTKSIIVAGSVATISDLNCIKEDGNEKISFTFKAHTEYKCEGSAYGSGGVNVNLQCEGSNSSKKKITGKLLIF
jgi:hypothetical protein